MDLTSEEVWKQIQIASDNSIYHENAYKSRQVAHIDHAPSNELQEVKDMLVKLLNSQKKVKEYSLCKSTDHITSVCPHPLKEK